MSLSSIQKTNVLKQIFLHFSGKTWNDYLAKEAKCLRVVETAGLSGEYLKKIVLKRRWGQRWLL